MKKKKKTKAVEEAARQQQMTGTHIKCVECFPGCEETICILMAETNKKYPNSNWSFPGDQLKEKVISDSPDAKS